MEVDISDNSPWKNADLIVHKCHNQKKAKECYQLFLWLTGMVPNPPLDFFGHLKLFNLQNFGISQHSPSILHKLYKLLRRSPGFGQSARIG
jgi:hypothetical protein